MRLGKHWFPGATPIHDIASYMYVYNTSTAMGSSNTSEIEGVRSRQFDC